MNVCVFRTILIVSALLPLCAVLLWYFLKRPGKRNSGSSLTMRGLTISLAVGVLAALWCVNYALIPFGLLNGGPKATQPTESTRVIAGFLRAVDAFGVDTGFQELVNAGKAMFVTLEWSAQWSWGLFVCLLGALYVGAPIISGFGILEILAGIFPEFQHWVSKCLGKERYYFSQLSDASVSLAESIRQVKCGFGKKPVLIFANADKADGDAETAKRLAKAKALSAVCIKKDLRHIQLAGWGKRKFFLMDDTCPEDGAVLQQLLDLADRAQGKYLKNAEVFLFLKTDSYEQVEKNLREKLEKEITEAKFPVILPVRCDFNLVANLLADVPLFEGLIGSEKEKRDLTVTVLGDTELAREMFLAVYWIGQILDRRLHIRVCAEEPETAFWAKIDRVNPEIRQSVTKDHAILKINPKGDMAEVYAHVEYRRCDPAGAWISSVGAYYADADYFFLALNTDQENIAMADRVRRAVGERHIAQQDGRKTVITYVVRDQQMADTLNQEKRFSYGSKAADIYMQAVGGLREVYSIRNVFMLNHDRYSRDMFDAYAALNNRENRKAIQTDRRKEEYKYWANLARSLHLIYKVYSAGWLKVSLFDPEDEGQILARRKQECQRAREIFYGNFPADFQPDPEAHVQLLHRLAWLEHRRWNAFTRVKGYRSTKLYETYGKLTKSHKQMELKLHPCLVECDQRGIRGEVTPEGKVSKETEAMKQCLEDGDYLDLLTYELKQLGLYKSDFKYYDYPFESAK